MQQQDKERLKNDQDMLQVEQNRLHDEQDRLNDEQDRLRDEQLCCIMGWPGCRTSRLGCTVSMLD
jgi:hypothetical protein